MADAWGHALLDQLEGADVAQPTLEVRGGATGPAMHPSWFFQEPDEWAHRERDLLDTIEDGPVLDLGCGAGRAALYLQDRGVEVTAIDSSPGAVDVCRRRGVHDARVGDLNAPPTDREWGAILLLCGNLGLGGTWEGNRALLTNLSELARPDAVLIGDSVDDTSGRNLELRIRYEDEVSPWWAQRNVAVDEVPAMVEGTGWALERHVQDGDDHAVLLRRQT